MAINFYQQGAGFDPTKLTDEDLANRISTLRNSSQANLGAGSQYGTNGLVAQNQTQALLQPLLQEQQTRQGKSQAATQQNQVQQYYDQAVPGGIDNQPFINEQTQMANNQIQGVNDTFNNQYQQGANNISQAYIPQKQGLVEDLASQNQLGQGNSRYSLDALAGQQARDISNLGTTLGASRGQALTGISQGLANSLQQGRQFAQGQQLQKAQGLSSALMGGNQFNQQLGLAQNQFNAGQGNNMFNNQAGLYGLNQAAMLGQQQADAQKQTPLQQFGQVASGIGSLAGGIGGLSTGLRGLGGTPTPKLPNYQSYA